MKCKRVLLKLSGEALAGPEKYGINYQSLENIAREIKKARKQRFQLALVVGAGNIWRGAGKRLDRVTADYMGMLATVMNALAIREILESSGIPAKVQSAFSVSKIAELYTRDKALQYLEDGNVVVFAGGTGNPYFTTDTTAALRAGEIKADLLLKATQVDGVYDDDPRKNPHAKKYKTLTFTEAIHKHLKIMDMAAFSLCRENNLPVIVFDFYHPGNLAAVLSGKKIGTLVTD